MIIITVIKIRQLEMILLVIVKNDKNDINNDEKK